MLRQLYTKIHDNWKDLPDKTTPVMAADLDHIEQGIYDNSANMALKNIYGDDNISQGRLVGTTVGAYSTSLGINTEASGLCSFSNGLFTVASGEQSHAEGNRTTASGNNSHAEGSGSSSSGNTSHAEGGGCTSSGSAAHSEGENCKASGEASHAEGGYTESKGLASHAEGNSTIASGNFSHVQGKFNIEDTENKFSHIVGGGTSDTDKKNIHTLDWNGNAMYAGTVESSGLILTDTITGTKYMLTVAYGNLDIVPAE